MTINDKFVEDDDKKIGVIACEEWHVYRELELIWFIQCYTKVTFSR